MNIKCNLCGLETTPRGMATHLKYAHNYNVNEYVDRYEEYRPKYIAINKKKELNQDKYQCQVCGEIIGSERMLTHHIKSQHQIKKEEYVLKYIFKNEDPKCDCGCGKPVSIINQFPYRRGYINGHQPNGMFNKRHDPGSILTMRKKAINRFGTSNKKDTVGEVKFGKILDGLNIKYEKQYPTEFGVVDFYLPEQDMFIEIDGIYWHPNKIEELNFQLISNVCSEINKMKINNLYRLYDSVLDNINSIGDIRKYSRNLNYDIGYRDVVLSKEYLSTKKNKENYVWLLKKFFRNYDFIYPTTTENLNDVIKKLPSKTFEPVNKEFSNNKSNIGTSYLKSNFKSYWNSSFKNRPTPIEAYNDDKILYDILKYRMGINKSNEIFDISFHQIIRGLSANRYTISFFKPLLAASIYKHFLGDIENPTVIDPCAGFGGRMLGFKSVYPGGKYIGIEPNKETFDELQELSKNFDNIELHNFKQEEYSGNLDCDLTFTSIPYFDTEIYSNHIDYNDIDNWSREFLKPLHRFKNKLINFPVDLRKYFPDGDEYKVISNTSHFNKNKIKKFEYLLFYQ